MNQGPRSLPLWLRVLLIAVLAVLALVALQATFAMTWVQFAIAIVVLAACIYGIVRLIRGWPREPATD